MRRRSRGGPTRRSSDDAPSSTGSSSASARRRHPRRAVASSCSASPASARRGSRRSSFGRSATSRVSSPAGACPMPRVRRIYRSRRSSSRSSAATIAGCRSDALLAGRARRRAGGDTARRGALGLGCRRQRRRLLGDRGSSSRPSLASGRSSSCSRTCTGPNRLFSTCSSTSSAGAPAHRSRSSASHGRSCSTLAPPGRPTRSRSGRSPSTRRVSCSRRFRSRLRSMPTHAPRSSRPPRGTRLFLEQLAAHALDGPLKAGRVPASLESLLASRLDSLPISASGTSSSGRLSSDASSRVRPSTRLRRTGGEGGNSAAGARPPAAHSAGQRASRRGRVPLRPRAHPRRDLCRHRQGRARSPPRAAGALARRAGGLDEIVGHHLEQACLYRREAGDDPAPLVSDAVERLRRAGERAVWSRDNARPFSLLTRAAALIPRTDIQRLEIECLLSVSLRNLLGDRARERPDRGCRAVRSGDRRSPARVASGSSWSGLFWTRKVDGDALLGDGRRRSTGVRVRR